MCARLPQHVQAPLVVQEARSDEKMISQAIEIAERQEIDGLQLQERAHQPFGTPTDGAGEVEVSGRRCTAWQNERGQGRALSLTGQPSWLLFTHAVSSSCFTLSCFISPTNTIQLSL